MSAIAAVPLEHGLLEQVFDRSRYLIGVSTETVTDARRLRDELEESKRRSAINLRQVHEKIDVARAWCTVPGVETAHGRLAPGVNLAVWILHVRFARSGSRRVLTELVDEYHAYAVGLARRMHRAGESLDDLEQVALEALVRSLERFEPSQSIPFPAFATPTIIGALKRHFRDRGYAVRLPRRLQEVDASTRNARDRLRATMGEEPSDEQVAQHAGCSLEALREAAQGVAVRRVASLDLPTNDGGASIERGSNDGALLHMENIVALRQVLDCLGDRDREVLGLYFLDEMSQQAIAERFGVSQMQVSRWISRSLKQLRSHLGAA